MTQIQLLTDLPVVGGVLLVLGGAAAGWWLVWRETGDLPSPMRWLLPVLRAAAIALVMAMLLEPVLHHRQLLGEPSRLRVWIDASESMHETDATAASRYERSVALLLGGDIPRLETWADTTELAVSRWAGDAATPLWSSSPRAEIPPLPAAAEWSTDFFSAGTNLSVPLEAALASRRSTQNGPADSDAGRDPATGEPAAASREPILLFTDGRHTFGSSPLDLLATWPVERMPVMVVGMGASSPPARLTIRGVESPTQLFRTDRIEGVIELVDHVPPGEPFRVAIEVDRERLDGRPAGSSGGIATGRPLWSESLVSDGSGLRLLRFSFPVESAIEQLSTPASGPMSENVLRLPLPLKAVVHRTSEAPSAMEAETAGRAFSWLVGITTRRQRVLILDGRGRWETRYLRNALERDPTWSVDAYLVKPGESPRWFSQRAEPVAFPDSADAWLAYDLVVTGEIEPTASAAAALKVLPEVVERGGIGWIVIDGQRDTWGADGFVALRAMLPVERLPQTVAALNGREEAWRPAVSQAAVAVGAFQLGGDGLTSNDDVWAGLPGFRSVVPARVVPGGEALVEVSRDGQILPLVSSRMFGAGRVVHIAGDETWRWRYQVADRIHQRFWNQVARWAMRMPFAVRNDHVALDTGDVMVPFGQPISVRALLQHSRGTPQETVISRAVAIRDGAVVSTLELVADSELPGLVHGQWATLPPGRYTIRIEATGFSREALDLETIVDVVAPVTTEQIDVSRDDELLRRIAEAGGGAYVAEERVQELWDRMALEQTAQLVQSDTEVWQSGGWFAVVMLLLAAEWWLRKRAGLT